LEPRRCWKRSPAQRHFLAAADFVVALGSGTNRNELTPLERQHPSKARTHMHRALFRVTCFLGLTLLTCHASAQEVGQWPSVDESKLSDSVKRQAASPQKFIINSTAVRPKAEPPQPAPVRTVRQADRKLPLQATQPSANRPGVQAAPATEPASSTAPAQASLLDSTTTEALAAPATTPTPMAATAWSASPPTPTQPPSAAVEAPTPAPALVLLNRVDPVLTPDLLDAPTDASVTVSFVVGIQGDVIDPQIAASGDRRLNRSVLRSLREWRYAPISEPRQHSVTFLFAPDK
jgi:TonB family protein